MHPFVASPQPVFNRARFQELTLDDKGLQVSLLAAFSREVECLRRGIAAAVKEGAEAFEDMVHRAKNVGYFVGGDRLTRMLASIGTTYLLAEEEDRSRAALAIAGELDALEQALVLDTGEARSDADRN